ncbi:MAG TPA: hypothetical protein VHE58_10900 [Burkholderiales bacterium]|nr:hypothetical protein [Burkholderiales bacterium]
MRHDHTTVVIPLGGNQLARGDVDQELAELKRLAPKVYAIVDSERSSASELPLEERRRFKTACDEAEIPAHITERRATENYLSERAIKACFGPTQRAFMPFETRDVVKPSWGKEDNWRIASLMSWEEISDTDVGKFLATYFPPNG